MRHRGSVHKQGQRVEDGQDGLHPVVLGVERGGRVKQLHFNPSTLYTPLYTPFDVAANAAAQRYPADIASDGKVTRVSRVPRGATSTEQQREALSLSVLLTTLLIMVGTFHVLAMIVVETNRWLEARDQIVRLERDIGIIRTDMTSLETQLVYREEDGVLEQLARRQGFIYPEETRVITSFNVFE